MASLGAAQNTYQSAVQALPDISLARVSNKHFIIRSPESLLANKRGATRIAAKTPHIEQIDDAARRRKSEQPANRADGPLGGSRTSNSNAAAENDAEEEARDARRGER